MTGIRTFTERARAKVNLTLHVGQVDENGYHPLQSLVVFADVGDELSLQMGNKTGLSIDGSFADGLPRTTDNLILKAARTCAPDKPAQFTLEKNLPVASGIGGGTADAAAAVRLLDRAYGIDPSVNVQTLGADFSVCFLSQTCWMEGIGHQLTVLPEQLQLPAILVNPNVHVSTANVFKTFDAVGITTPFLDKATSLSILDVAKSGGNDLQSAAISLAPVIQTVIEEIEQQAGCQLARMSGSGATCFGIFETMRNAQQAAKLIKSLYPDWWCVSTLLGGDK